MEGATYCHGNHITGSGIARKKRLVSLFFNFLEGEGGGGDKGETAAYTMYRDTGLADVE